MFNSGGNSCSFTDCFWSVGLTFGITIFILLIIHIWLYFRLVAIAKKQEGFTGQQGGNTDDVAGSLEEPLMPLKDAFKDPYHGIQNFTELREHDLWKLYLVDKKRQQQQKGSYPIEPKYFNLLSTKFLESKGYDRKQIKYLRSLGGKWNSFIKMK